MTDRRRKRRNYEPPAGPAGATGAGATGAAGTPVATGPGLPDGAAGPTGVHTVKLDQCPACGALEWFTKLDAEKPVKICRGCGNQRP